jgi:AcrR family transcriptional regulator
MMPDVAPMRHGSRMARQQVVSLPPKAGEKLSRTRQRQKLIDACISALYLHGPSRTTIDKVVAIADMSPGIVNFYFETKAALLVAALDYLAAEFDERVLAPLAALLDSPVVALERLIELYLDPDIASPRKVSVWYAFWGEASSRREYSTICGKRDLAFADLVRDLVARLIGQTGAAHLDANAVALGLIGSLEMMWQEIAFQEEADVDREAARLRCRAYLRSVFPTQFAAEGVGEPQQAARGEVIAALDTRPTNYITKQLGDACEMLVAAELNLAGVPAFKAPDYWPGRGVIAQPPGRDPQRILVKSGIFRQGAAFVGYSSLDVFEWLAIVLLPGDDSPVRRCFIVPRSAADEMARRYATEKTINLREYRIDNVERKFAAYEDNFRLSDMRDRPD